jgi:sugar phosphate isomerase/epimerase
VKRAVERLRGGECRMAQLSAALPGLRPRELDQRARRDVLGLLSRNGLALSGLDLMIPHRDWSDVSTQQRAIDAVGSAVKLAGDFGRVPLSLSLPIAALTDAMRRELLTCADGCGVMLAIHAEGELDALLAWLDAEDQPMLKAAVDPAALLAGGEGPADAVIRLAKHLRVARLDDFSRTSLTAAGGRCPLGEGDLNLLNYRAALSTITKLQSLLIELRDLPDPVSALQTALDVW